MQTVSQLARQFALSRSTLLYYDSIGLLKPSGCSKANYRLYSKSDCHRLETICRYREGGLALDEIRQLLDGSSGKVAAIMEGRLGALNSEIAALREQQRVVVRLLRDPAKLRRARALDKQAWVALLRATGLTEAEMRKWHVEFERMAPEAHRDFLESLGIPVEEIRSIRRWSRLQ